MLMKPVRRRFWSPSRYHIALGDEPDRLQYVPIRTIQSMDPPEDFVRLWTDELAEKRRQANVRKHALTQAINK